MLGTNGELRALVGSIDREMRQHEWEVRWGNRLNSAVVTRLGELRDIRRLLVRVLANRKAEASKRVVDFGQWLNGRGALHERPAGAKPDAGAARRNAPLPPAAK